MMRRWLMIMGLLGILVGCDALMTAPTATPIVISKQLATAYISPTPNEDQRQATRLASSPIPITMTPTRVPSPTAYVGVFIGRAEREASFPRVNAPWLGNNATQAAQTAIAQTCATPIQSFYVTAWNNTSALSSRIGCPIQVGFGFVGSVQVFERGVMYRRAETREVWAIITSDERGRYWYVEAPPERILEGIVIPSNFIVPVGDMLAMWLGVEGLRDRLGYALSEEQPIDMGLQRFESGTFLLDASSGQVFGLIVDGTAYGPFAAPEGRPEALFVITPTPSGGLVPLGEPSAEIPEG